MKKRYIGLCDKAYPKLINLLKERYPGEFEFVYTDNDYNDELYTLYWHVANQGAVKVHEVMAFVAGYNSAMENG